MSLINKMLQDLDKRGTAPGEAARQDVAPVVYDDGKPGAVKIAGAVAVGLAVVLGAAFVWSKRAMPNAPAPVVLADRAAPAAPVKPAPLVEQLSPELVDDTPASPPAAAPEPEPEGEAAAAPVKAEPKPAPKPAPKPPQAAKPARAEKPVKAPAAPVAKAAAPAAVAAAGRQVTPNQRAESEYRRGLASLQEGRVTEAISALQQAVRIDGRHDAARQTLVGLLVESNRRGEAMHVLQSGLILDPRQPAMAMLLARLQIEGGTSGIETLMRTLPYANGNGEYHAFLAGALARDDRHREAAEQYQAALRSAPGNGVWWMGLGMSLQAERRNPEALAAFARARDASNLTPQLRTFVERKLQALSN